MSTVGPSVLGGLVAGVLSGCVLTPLVLGLLLIRRHRLPPRRCPNCAAPVPSFSRPQSLEQALWGSRTCQKCGHTVPGWASQRA